MATFEEEKEAEKVAASGALTKIQLIKILYIFATQEDSEKLSSLVVKTREMIPLKDDNLKVSNKTFEKSVANMYSLILHKILEKEYEESWKQDLENQKEESIKKGVVDIKYLRIKKHFS